MHKRKLEMPFQRHWCAKNGKNLLITRLILEMKFDLETEIFKVKGVCGNFFTIFYVFSASKYIRKPSKNLAYIRNKIWPWIDDFKGQGCLREFSYYFFHIQRVKLHRNIVLNLHDRRDKFFTLHFTLPGGLTAINTPGQHRSQHFKSHLVSFTLINP